MKKKLFFLSIAASFVLLATSCKKGEDAAPTAQGYWEGKSGTGQNAPNNFYAILVRNNGTIRAYFDGTDTTNATGKTDGTYTLINGLIKTEYGSFKTNATVNANFTHMEGTLGESPSNNNIGTFFLDKK